MSGRSYFIFNGKSSLEMSIQLVSPPPLTMPEKRALRYTVEGRPGQVIISEGEEAFAPYVVVISCLIRREWAQPVIDWLGHAASGIVTFSSDPERAQECRVLASSIFSRRHRNSEFYEGEIQFLCQPLKRDRGKRVTRLAASGNPHTVVNSGRFTERPKITLTANAENVTITVNSSVFSIAEAEGNTIIDCDAGMVLAGDTLITARTHGDFPTLRPGANDVSFTGATELIIERNERYL